MQQFLTALTAQFPPHKLKQKESMASHTSFHTGGFAEYFYEVDSQTEFVTLINLAREFDVPVTLLGGGSFSLVSDNGIEGLVIKNKCRKFELMSFQGKIRNRQLDVDRVFVYAESGALLNQVVRSTLDGGYEGLEYALGVPGTVGGAIAVNAEYIPQNFFIGETLYKARILTKDGIVKDVEKGYFHFEPGYSNLQSTGDILLSVMFVVTPGHKATLWQRGQEAATYRTSIPEQEKSYGLTYRSIHIDKTDALLAHNSFPSLDYLFTHAGLKGIQKGNAMLSSDNPRFLINMGSASTREAVSLLRETQRQVKEKYQTSLCIQMKEIGV